MLEFGRVPLRRAFIPEHVAWLNFGGFVACFRFLEFNRFVADGIDAGPRICCMNVTKDRLSASHSHEVRLK